MYDIDTVVCGMALGVDTFGLNWGKNNGLSVDEYPADWKQYGRRAGFIRNMEMAYNADMLIAFWDGRSRGTKDMIDKALSLGLDIHVYTKEI